jgi:hypothetical protein
MKRLRVVMLALTLAACGGSVRPALPDDAAVPADAMTTGDAEAPADGGVDAPVAAPDAQLPPVDERAVLETGGFVGGAGTLQNRGNNPLRVDITVGHGTDQAPTAGGSITAQPGVLQGQE